MPVFDVTGKIRGKARARITRFGTYTPKTSKDYETLIKGCFVANNGTYTEKPVNVGIIAYFQYPKSYTKKKKAETPIPMKKPDIDNIAKSVLDALNGVAYKDDAQVVSLNVSKYWTQGEERLRVYVFETSEKEE